MPVSETDDPEAMAADWTLPRIHGDWPRLVEVVAATISAGFDQHWPIRVHPFACDQHGRGCSWPEEFETDREEPHDRPLRRDR